MKKDTYYFSHDYNAHNDTKILYMRHELGMEGYGIYWFLVECLADSGGILPLKIVPVLAKQMDVSVAKVNAIINSYDLFKVSDIQFFSERLIKHLELREGLSEAGKLGAQKRWDNIKNGGAISHPNAKERKGKEKKGKEIKYSTISENNNLKNSNLFRKPNIPTFEQVHEHFKNCGGTKEMAEKFFNKNSSTDWFINNSPIINFKSLIPNFISNYKSNEQQHSKSNSKTGKKLTSDERFEIYRTWADQFSDDSPQSNG